jgi:hypothetical protein
MATTIRLMCDWGLYPFWVQAGDEDGFTHMEPDDFQEMFGLPEPVMCALLAWDELYQGNLNWSDPLGTDWARLDDELHYTDRGRDVARLLRRHVPAEVRIEYRGYDNIAPEYY